MKKTTNPKDKSFLRLSSLIVLFSIICASTVFAQIKVSGKVIDNKGETLPGVSILEDGTSNGTVTDVNGEFALLVSSGSAKLTFSYVGFVSQTINVGNSTFLEIQLEEDVSALDEVVVIGYGTAKKSDLTGAVASIGSEKITEMNKVDIAQSLQGRIAGVSVRTLNGKPGAGLSIKIRGNTVIQNANLARDGLSDDPLDDLSRPLYVIDGIFVDDISALNPNDIEKIDILKDASATAIYGSRGANGVVIISTKSGFEGQTSISYDATVGFSTAANVPEMRSGESYVQLVDDYARHLQWIGESNFTRDNFYGYSIDRSIALTPEEQQNVANGTYTDWVGLF
ncbi:MAG: carboxypeptidase-like regulatory domain-containing protein, partial [Bacteroidota bacterium]